MNQEIKSFRELCEFIAAEQDKAENQTFTMIHLGPYPLRNMLLFSINHMDNPIKFRKFLTLSLKEVSRQTDPVIFPKNNTIIVINSPQITKMKKKQLKTLADKLEKRKDKIIAIMCHEELDLKSLPKFFSNRSFYRVSAKLRKFMEEKRRAANFKEDIEFMNSKEIATTQEKAAAREQAEQVLYALWKSSPAAFLN